MKKTPLAFIEITKENAYKIEPGREVTIQFEGAGKCVVEVSRIQNDLALIDISSCDTVLELRSLIPKRPISKKVFLKFGIAQLLNRKRRTSHLIRIVR